MAARPQFDVAHERIQAAGKQLVTYIFSLIKTGEVHELNNEAWYRPTEKLSDNLDTLLKIERQSITFVIHEGVAQVNSHALWLDSNTIEQAEALEQFLARREAGGIIFPELPPEGQIKQFFNMFARYTPPEDAESQFTALQDALIIEGITKVRLAPQPLRLEGIGTGVRGVASLWYYAKCVAGMGLVLTRTPLDVKAGRRVAQDMVDACASEQDLMCALPLLGVAPSTPAKRALDLCILCAATGRGLGLTAVHCAELATAGLLHGSGQAYENPDPAEFTVPELAGTMAVMQLVEGSQFGAALAQRVSAAVECAIGPDGQGAPYLAGPPQPLTSTQLVTLAALYLDRCRGENGQLKSSPLAVGIDLLTSPPPEFDSNLVKTFVAVVGLMPIGTVVEMMNGDVGVVSDVEHLRGRDVYRATPPPVTRQRKIFIERMRTAKGKVVGERKARIELESANEQGQSWTAVRTLDPEPWRELVTRAIIRRPATVVAQLGLKARA